MTTNTHIRQDARSICGRSCCTVLALANVAGLTIEQANVITTAAGRERGKGVQSQKVIDAARKAGLQFIKLRISGWTLRRFARERFNGRFYIRKQGHAFAVIHGTPSDSTALGARILDVWQFIGGEVRA